MSPVVPPDLVPVVFVLVREEDAAGGRHLEAGEERAAEIVERLGSRKVRLR